jgi:hypothetical protein
MDNSPRDMVRATLSWQGDANLDLIVTDEQQVLTAGYAAATGAVVNEIPDATHQGDVGAPGGTEQFVDHAWHPNPFLAPNRHFYYGVCRREHVPEPIDATLTFVRAMGDTLRITVPFKPPPPPGESGSELNCAAWYG